MNVYNKPIKIQNQISQGFPKFIALVEQAFFIYLTGKRVVTVVKLWFVGYNFLYQAKIFITFSRTAHLTKIKVKSFQFIKKMAWDEKIVLVYVIYFPYII